MESLQPSRRLTLVLAVVGCLLASGGCRQPAASRGRLLVRLEPKKWTLENFVLSDNAARFAYVKRVGENDWFVVVDGSRPRRVGCVRSGDPEFSPDSRRVAYAIRTDGGVAVVVDGKTGPTYDDIGPGRLFSADSRRVAYVVRRGRQSLLVVNGQEGTTWDGIGAHVLSPAGDRTAFVARRGNRWCVVSDGRESPPLDAVLRDGVKFSPDGRRLAWVASRADTWLVVLDDSVIGRHSGALYPTFSPDSRRFAYLARSSDGWRVVCDGVAGPVFRSPVSRLEFSPDSRRLACGVECPDGATAVLVDGRFGPQCVDLSCDSAIVFSPDSRRVAWLARDTSNRWALVVDDTAGPLHAQVGVRPVFSPDSRRVAYWARDGIEGRVIVDGVADTAAFIGLEQGRIRFSPDSRHYAYAGWRGKDWFYVLDGAVSGPFAYPPLCGSRLDFLPGGDLVYLARQEDDIRLVRVRPR